MHNNIRRIYLIINNDCFCLRSWMQFIRKSYSFTCHWNCSSCSSCCCCIDCTIFCFQLRSSRQRSVWSTKRRLCYIQRNNQCSCDCLIDYSAQISAGAIHHRDDLLCDSDAAGSVLAAVHASNRQRSDGRIACSAAGVLSVWYDIHCVFACNPAGRRGHSRLHRNAGVGSGAHLGRDCGVWGRRDCRGVLSGEAAVVFRVGNEEGRGNNSTCTWAAADERERDVDFVGKKRRGKH